ncbi:DUF1152 domain-containing protein [Actinomadura rupiterrae]|uniref:DUF1152 domain-containing protein n=1 Tax=Actinomadura rupiterrae TaxID=559627 RepID=UPI0020A40BE8|nr:DUF1152 domain-containing protein [Actinomadura rupiterrae]MCP2337940.1 hypothetical protein [Actinomadura rupiterrae]
MSRLLIAAGGGGDALAAAIIHVAAAIRRMSRTEPAAIATWAWDRLAVDPRPGPRGVADFTGLGRVGEQVAVITENTRPLPPAGSTLPRLAAELGMPLFLLDPAGGATGLHAQIRELVTVTESRSVEVVDVGGDVLARGDEVGLRSPLADALILAACDELGLPVTVLVAGPGLDGELTEAEVLSRTGSDLAGKLTAADVDRYAHILDWHPSEATALLVAAARGLRGTAEIRGGGLPVRLTDRSLDVYRLPLTRALALNPAARALRSTRSLDGAEAVIRRYCGFSEIDFERQKAAGSRRREPLREVPDDEQVRAFEQQTAARGIDYVTFRRVAEVFSLRHDAAANLRSQLIATRPNHYAPPLWRTRPKAS